MAGVAKYSISQLDSGMTNIMVIGIVIAKQQPRIFANKKCPNGKSSTDRAVFNLTIRDSPQDCINVSRWGMVSTLVPEAESVHIGDVVEIINARVAFRSDESSRYSPYTSSLFSLVVSDDGQIGMFSADLAAYKTLLHVTTRPAHDYTILAQVDTTDGKEELPKTANFLAVVIKVEQVQVMKTKDNRQIEKQSVRLLDFTANAVPMDIWDPEYIKRAAKWRSRETVLYISDAIVKWNDYKKCKLISVGCCTVITENPNVPEAIAVRNYAKTVPLNYSEILDNMTNKIPDLSTIKNQMSVQQVKEKIADKQSFYALVNAFLSKLNIDGPAEVVSMRCWHCHRLKKREEDFCSNGDCLEKEPTFSSSFNIHVSLTDRTGTLDNVRLSGAAAERILGIDADSFLEKDEEELSQLKWKFLLEKWDMKIAVQEIDRMRPLVTLLSCEPASPQESSARGISMN